MALRIEGVGRARHEHRDAGRVRPIGKSQSCDEPEWADEDEYCVDKAAVRADGWCRRGRGRKHRHRRACGHNGPTPVPQHGRPDGGAEYEQVGDRRQPGRPCARGASGRPRRPGRRLRTECHQRVGRAGMVAPCKQSLGREPGGKGADRRLDRAASGHQRCFVQRERGRGGKRHLQAQHGRAGGWRDRSSRRIGPVQRAQSKNGRQWAPGEWAERGSPQWAGQRFPRHPGVAAGGRRLRAQPQAVQPPYIHGPREG